MNKVNRTIFLTAVMATMMFVFIGCGDSHTKDFNRLLLDLADKDETIDRDDWAEIEKFLDSQKAHFGEFFNKGQIDVEDVKDYISSFFDRRRPSKEIQSDTKVGHP